MAKDFFFFGTCCCVGHLHLHLDSDSVQHIIERGWSRGRGRVSGLIENFTQKHAGKITSKACETRKKKTASNGHNYMKLLSDFLFCIHYLKCCADSQIFGVIM